MLDWYFHSMPIFVFWYFDIDIKAAGLMHLLEFVFFCLLPILISAPSSLIRYQFLPNNSNICTKHSDMNQSRNMPEKIFRQPNDDDLRHIWLYQCPPFLQRCSVVIVGPSKLLQLSVVLMPTDFGLHCLSVCLLGGERERTPLVATRKLQDWPPGFPQFQRIELGSIRTHQVPKIFED